MKKRKQTAQVKIPEPSGVCATCFFNFHSRTSETGYYCIKNKNEVLPNGSC